MLSMPQKSRSRSTLTHKKMKKNIKEIKKNGKGEKKTKKSRGLPPCTICSKFTFFSVLLPDKALIKTAMCSVKLLLVLVTSFHHTYIHTMVLQFQHIHINIQIYTATTLLCRNANGGEDSACTRSRFHDINETKREKKREIEE